MTESGDYISREAALRDWPLCDEPGDAYQFIRNFPAADVRPVRRGTWIDMGDFISCSSCNATRLKEFESDYGKVMRLDARANFCPKCGARMEES